MISRGEYPALIPCRRNPDLFTSSLCDDQRRAVRLCRECPVMDTCLTDAWREQDFSSVRGGLTGDERRRIERRRAG